MTGADSEGVAAIALLLIFWLGLRLLTCGWFSGGAAEDSLRSRGVLGAFVTGMLSFAVVFQVVFDVYARGLRGPDVTLALALAMIVGRVLVPPAEVLVAVIAPAVYVMDSVLRTLRPQPLAAFLTLMVFYAFAHGLCWQPRNP